MISIPSLHAADAILFEYALRHVRWLFPASVVWNTTMIYSAIQFGAHCLVDIVAGLALSVTSVMIVRRWLRKSLPVA
ncbi:hypothetical protein DIE14_06095 [Burkholderia sp. Bp9017]|uniref:Phosphatase PAP2 family protein n=1 Tax=Burkholderia anthina TaxID=179879 RepID=A0A7T6VHS0_9BURK|nr:phosphatase PAP2 family protein [Burkholderia anthina]QQK04174.1 phosphatase PAP2 family protein [Burkholderia anthina]RQZ29626.1 hypothetical protein DIE14_06095 [Burkholderia sp. Bp9017]RQZ37129.1 hypothetical protein DIE13_03145 [Burkholderia sp. Bp9016]